MAVMAAILKIRQQKLIFMQSVNGLVPKYISDLIPPSVGEISTYTRGFQ